MKMFFWVFIFLLTAVSLVNATPPRDLQLKYDPVGQSLMITMKHPTSENREHYIRTILVSVNEEDPKLYRFTFQKLAWGVETVVPLVVKAGDTIHVKVKCILGGSAEAELAIPSADKKQTK